MSDVPHRRFRPTRCPHCGYMVDAASVVEGNTPKPRKGDMAVCFDCGEVAQFDRKLRLVKIPASLLAELNPEEAADLKRTQSSIRAFNQMRHQ